ncbi:thioredoxin family protein [Dehalogenimonas alkenigignens]|uniref:Small redox-active disulfide protein 2 n=1 Tax=Dehalogenimonas alkenigignens TaxID=1217799 RepID=A0A0W0GHK9_9CHLR|nr:thioredoxin family protein [Dehalogenimonas alkenigignens]KTB48033.1 small redox-active disulfide protein 2 [Dehalogenimonas alkenigignens]PVV84289.1 thioredoxin family protein [Dehalogenimonas alkenigignens]
MKIKILGTGCPKCQQLEAITRDAVKEMGIDAEIEKVKDIAKIMAYPVMMTPALVIDEKVVLSGKVPTKTEVSTLLKNASAR